MLEYLKNAWSGYVVDKDNGSWSISRMLGQGMWTGYVASENADFLKNDKINARWIRTPTSTSPNIASIFQIIGSFIHNPLN